MDEQTRYSADFVKRIFFDQANRYRIIAFKLIDVFEREVYWVSGKYYDDETKEQVNIGDKLPEWDAFGISMSDLTDGKETIEYASILGGIDTPLLLPQESEALIFLMQDWFSEGTTNHWQDIIGDTMYLDGESRLNELGKHHAENWTYEGPFQMFHFERNGMIPFETESLVDVSYCMSNGHVSVVAFPELEENVYCGVIPFVPKSDAESHVCTCLKEGIEYILNNRSEQLKMALAEPETFIQKRNRRYWELHQNSEMSIPEIARTVAEEYGMKEPDSVRNVQTGAKQHHDEHCPDISFKERPKGRRKYR